MSLYSSGPLAGFPSRTSISHDMSNFMPQLGRTTGNEHASTNFGPINGMDVRSAYVDGHTNYYDSGAQNTNGFQTHHMSISLGDGWKEGDTCKGMPTWVKGPKSVINLNPQITSYCAFSLPMLNHMLKYEWRDLYGKHLSIQPFLEDWRYVGTQQTKELERENGCYSTECNFIIGGRVRQQAFYHANQQPDVSQIANGSQAYVIYTRHEYTGNRVLKSSTWDTAVSDSCYDFDDDDDQDMLDDYQVVSAASEQSSMPIASELDKAADATFEAAYRAKLAVPAGFSVDKPQYKVQAIKARHDRNTRKEYYWSIDPWIAPHGTDPHPSTWTGLDPDNEFVGDYKYMGLVTHTLGGSDNACTGSVSALARAGLYPKSRGIEYQVAINALPHIELMQTVKHSQTVSL